MFEPFFKRHGLSFCALFFTGKIFFNTSALYGGLIQKIPLSLLFFFFFELGFNFNLFEKCTN